MVIRRYKPREIYCKDVGFQSSYVKGEETGVSIDSPWVKPAYQRWQPFVDTGQKRVYGPNQIIYTQGQHSEGLFYLHTGRVKVSILLPNGNEKILAIHDAPATFGESAAFDGGPYFATAFALQRSEVFLIPPSRLKEICLSHPEVNELLFQAFARKIRLLALQVEDMAALTVPARVAHMLLKLVHDYGMPTGQGYEVKLPITHEELANVIGTSRATVTGILNELARKGVIRKRRCQFIVLDPAYLEQLAQKP